jgi:hypothetical protein
LALQQRQERGDGTSLEESLVVHGRFRCELKEHFANCCLILWQLAQENTIGESGA